MRTALVFMVWCIGCASIWSGCSDDNSANARGDASDDSAARSETKNIGSQGGAVSLDEVTLDIPAGALDHDVTIRITSTTGAVPDGYRARSHLYRFEPSGQTFQVPVEVKFSLGGDLTPVQILWSGDGTSFEARATTAGTDFVKATVSHFSLGVAAEPARDAAPAEDAAPARDAASCDGLECLRPTNCPGGPNTTTLSGTVRDPAGKNPLYDATVYIPNHVELVAPIANGASCTRCEPTSGIPISVTRTDAAGHFVLSNVPASTSVPIVIQVGKWRRIVNSPPIAPCTDNALDGALTRLPKNRTEGHIPKIAIATGGADALECLLRKIGIDDSEFGIAGEEAPIHLYAGYGYNNGTTDFVASSSFASGKAFPRANVLWGTAADTDNSTLKQYDITLLSCEGETDIAKNAATKPRPANLYDYAKIGGRVYVEHDHSYWLSQGPIDVQSVGVWDPTAPPPALPSGSTWPAVLATVDRSFPKGTAFFDWLNNVGALNADGTLPIVGARQDLDSVDGAKAKAWLRVPKNPSATTGDAMIAQYISVNAPVAAADEQLCGRMVFSDIHASMGNSQDKPGYPFPSQGGQGCVSSDMSPQEKALEYMLFDLSSCIQNDNLPSAP